MSVLYYYLKSNSSLINSIMSGTGLKPELVDDNARLSVQFTKPLTEDEKTNLDQVMKDRGYLEQEGPS